MPSYVDGAMRVLSPGVEYVNFTKTGTNEKRTLSIESKFHKPLGKQPKGPPKELPAQPASSDNPPPVKRDEPKKDGEKKDDAKKGDTKKDKGGPRGE